MYRMHNFTFQVQLARPVIYSSQRVKQLGEVRKFVKLEKKKKEKIQPEGNIS